MYEVSAISKRYFSVKIAVMEEDGQAKALTLDVAPAKLKVLKRITAVRKAPEEEVVPELIESVRELLNNNKTGYKVPEEYIAAMSLEQLTEILNAYFGWLNNERNSPK